MTAATANLDSRPLRRAVRPRLECLEPRLALAATSTLGVAVSSVHAAPRAAVVGEALVVEGTSGSDRIRLMPTRSAGVVRVIADGRVFGNYGPVASIDVAAAAGNDTVVVDPRITLPTRLDGGAGNDRLRGGSGPNALLGEAGNDTLTVTPSRDTFDGGPGRTQMVNLRSLGVIQVGPSASGAGLRRLSVSYTLMPLQAAGPAVVGAADLGNARTVALLKNSYDGGQTVALANASEDDANTLARMLGDPRPVSFGDGLTRYDLVAFRKINEGGRSIYRVDLLAPNINAPTAPVRRSAARLAAIQSDRAYLAKVFTPSPSIPAPPRVGDAPNNLLQLANAYVISTKKSFPDGTVATIEATAYAIRSFLNQFDLYYISEETDVSTAYSTTEIPNVLLNSSSGPNYHAFPQIVQPSPQTNQGTTTITTGVNVNIGGSLGWNQAQGANASVNGGVTIINQKSTTVPPISIDYVPDLDIGATAYSFAPTSGPARSLTLYTSWIWQLPFSAYEGSSPSLSFGTDYTEVEVGYGPQFGFNGNIPAPFGGTFQLASPDVSGVSNPTVTPGELFTIQGSAFYPSLVQSVLIGGQALSPSNFTVLDDGQIQVLSPDMLGNRLSVVVKTTEGFSNANVALNIVPSLGVTVTTQPVAAVAGQELTSEPVATFTDSAPGANPADATVMIDWGDGSSSQGVVTPGSSGGFNVSGSHTYAASGTYTFSVQVTDPDGNKATAPGTATVAAPADTGGPQNLAVRPVAAVAGQAFTNVTLATFTDSDPNASPPDFTAAITWGDGIATPITTVNSPEPGAFNVLGTHKYVTSGTYTFYVQITDNKGHKVTTSGTATVSRS